MFFSATIAVVALLSLAEFGEAASTEKMVNPKDGSILLRVPAGDFIMGSAQGASDERPPHKVSTSAFWISSTPVTNRQYRHFLKTTHYPRYPNWEEFAKIYGEDAPAVCLNWHDAAIYSRWAGLRLPTEAEWEKAARGTDERLYPWGNNWDPSRLIYNDNSNHRAHQVGSCPNGASPYGCLDMAGNVWQWCSSKGFSYPYSASDGREDPAGQETRIARGGSFWSRPEYCNTARRLKLPPYDRSICLGFRCARDN